MSYRNNKRKKRYRVPRGYVYIAAGALCLFFIIVVIFAAKKYTPTREHTDLKEYFELSDDSDAAVILNCEYIKPTDDLSHGYAMISEDCVYFEIGFIKDYLDDLMEKTDIHSRTVLVAQAARTGIVVSNL